MKLDTYWQNITDIFREKVNAFNLQSRFAELGKEISMGELQLLNDNFSALLGILDREFLELTNHIKKSK